MEITAWLGVEAAWLGLVATIIGISWYLGHRLGRLDYQAKIAEQGSGYLVKVLEQRLGHQAKILNGLLGLVGQLTLVMHRRGNLNTSEFQQIIRTYTLPEERERFNNYLAKSHQGVSLLPSGGLHQHSKEVGTGKGE